MTPTSELRSIGKGVMAFVAVAAAVPLLATIRRYDPLQVDWLPACPFYYLTGFWCPGCGATRAAHALLNWRLWEAFGHNPLLFSVGPLVAAVWLISLLGTRGASVAQNALAGNRVWYLLGVIVMFTVLRNLPFEVFALLAP